MTNWFLYWHQRSSNPRCQSVLTKQNPTYPRAKALGGVVLKDQSLMLVA
ncbi:hypothetical protein [Xenorhabdus nematophila]|nr:hypothetical protein [Xenorhabdus nematophila]